MVDNFLISNSLCTFQILALPKFQRPVQYFKHPNENEYSDLFYDFKFPICFSSDTPLILPFLILDNLLNSTVKLCFTIFKFLKPIVHSKNLPLFLFGKFSISDTDPFHLSCGFCCTYDAHFGFKDPVNAT